MVDHAQVSTKYEVAKVLLKSDRFDLHSDGTTDVK